MYLCLNDASLDLGDTFVIRPRRNLIRPGQFWNSPFTLLDCVGLGDTCVKV